MKHNKPMSTLEAGWNLPSATIDGQHWFPAATSEALCSTVFYAGVRVPGRDARYPTCPRCLKALAPRSR